MLFSVYGMLRRGLGNKAHHKPVTAHSARAASLNAFGGFLVEVRLWRQAAQTIWIPDAMMTSKLEIMNVHAGVSRCHPVRALCRNYARVRTTQYWIPLWIEAAGNDMLPFSGLMKAARS